MKEVTIYIFVLLAIIDNCSSCKKSPSPAPDNPYGLPNATQTGANVLACQINGQNFIAYYKLGVTGAQLDSGNIISVFGTKTYSNFVYANLGFSIKNPVTSTIYSNNSSIFRFVTDSTCLGYSSPSVTVNASNANIKITKFDTLTRVISGVFTAKIPIPNCDTINITEGRFDFNYYKNF